MFRSNYGNAAKIAAPILCAASFLLLSYQFGTFGAFSTGTLRSYALFACSSALVALAVLLVVYIQWLQYAANDYVSKMAEIDYVENRHCKDLIQHFRRPLVSLETKPENVAEVAAGAIRDVLKRSTEEGRRVIFFGAASLQTPPKGWVPVRAEGVDAEDEQSPHQIYQGALEAAASSRAHVERYVRLIGKEFDNRSITAKNDYVKWLKNQLSQMTRNENFVLIDSTRAPKWGTSGARIMAGEVLIDLTHKSGAAIVIRDERIAAEQIASGIKAAISVQQPGNLTVYSKVQISDLTSRFGPKAQHRLSSELLNDYVRLKTSLSNN